MSDDPSIVKKELRSIMREERAALTEAERTLASQRISARVLRFLEKRRLCDNTRVALYLAGPREPNLDDVLIKELQMHGYELFAPHYGDNREPFYSIAPQGVNIEEVPLGEISSGEMRLRAPCECSAGVARSAEELDVIFIPGLAFDLHGHRLGQGGGWYDRVLARSKNALRIGVCFDFQVIENVPHEEHDQRMNFIVTEKRIIEL